MKHPISTQQQQIDKINECSLSAYMKLLGHTPTLINEQVTVFDLPMDRCLGATLITDNKQNRFRLTTVIQNGRLTDLARLLFLPAPADILDNPGAYKLDKLLADSDAINAGQP